MPQLQKVKICQHVLHGPLGNLLALYTCKNTFTSPKAEGVDDAVEAGMGGSLVGGGGGGGVTWALAIPGGGVGGASGWLALEAASADAPAVPGGGVGGGGGWLAPEAAPWDATRNSNLCLPWRFVLPV